MFTELPELLKGLTDLPIALASALFFILLLRQGKRDWAALFLLLGGASLLGAAVHCFAIPAQALRLLWCCLYVLLYELLRRFAQRMVCCISGRRRPEMPVVFLLEGALYLMSATLCLMGRRADIYCMVLFAALLLLRILVCMRRSPAPARDARRLLLLLLLALLVQALKDVIPHGVVWGHMVILLALFSLYRFCRRADGAG